MSEARLTREEIGNAGVEVDDSGDRLLPNEIWLKLRDLALSALDREAVLEEMAARFKRYGESAQKSADTEQDERDRAWAQGRATAYRRCEKDCQALKREPNAAAQALPGKDGVYEAGQRSDKSDASKRPSPAPAAPDVAEMVKRLRYIVDTDDARFGGITHTLYEAATLLEKLGQGWVPVGWVQEHNDGRKSFYAGVLDPRDVHDNGFPTYQVFKAPGASDD